MPPVRPVPARAGPLQANQARKPPSPRTRLRSKHGKEIARNDMTNKNKSRICYECRQKGHMGKDCPNGNIPKSNLVHYDFHKLRNDKNGTCAIREISSPLYSMRDIWVPKHLVTNPIGPNKCWVQKKCLLSLQVKRDALSTWLEELEITLYTTDHVKEKLV
jgi:hypothetical protein